jgi:hypothetical protein
MENEDLIFEIDELASISKAREMFGIEIELKGNILYFGDHRFVVEVSKTSSITVRDYLCNDKKKEMFGRLWCSVFRRGMSQVEEIISTLYVSPNLLTGSDPSLRDAETLLDDSRDNDIRETLKGYSFFERDDCPETFFIALFDLVTYLDTRYGKSCFVCGRQSSIGICRYEMCIHNFLDNPSIREEVNEEVFQFLHTLVTAWAHSPKRDDLFPFFPSCYATRNWDRFIEDLARTTYRGDTPLKWWVTAAPSCFVKLTFEGSTFKPTFSISRRDDPVLDDYQVAYHGSPLCNWLSIFSNGLLSLSKTKHQQNGALYGAGVYLAKDLQTSLAYAKGGRVAVVAECRIPRRYTASPYFVINECNVIQMVRLHVIF